MELMVMEAAVKTESKISQDLIWKFKVSKYSDKRLIAISKSIGYDVGWLCLKSQETGHKFDDCYMGMRKVSDWDYRKIKESQLESNRLGII